MTGSASGQDEANLCSDWLPEWARWPYLARSGFPALFPQKRKIFRVIFWPHNKSFIEQACSVKMLELASFFEHYP